MRKRFAKAATPHQPTPANDDRFECEPVRIGLVLTGGGSHGAYEAGVLKAITRKLQRMGTIVAISGTSAGAFNAITFGSGLNANVADGVEEAIKRSEQGWNVVKSNGHLYSRGLRFFSDFFLPKNQQWPNLPSIAFNPLGLLQPFAESSVAKFISKTVKGIVKNWASDVQNGTVRIYINTVLEKRNAPGEFEHILLSGKNLTPDGVGASANLKPLGVHCIEDTQNPEHKGRRAYDGAYKENGSLDPMIDNNVTDCIMIVLHDRRHNKLDKKGELKHAEIHSHALEVAAQDSCTPMRFHSIEIESLGGEIGGLGHMDDSSKMNANAEFIDMLYAAGEKAGEAWFEKHGASIGLRSSYPFYQPALEQFSEMNYA